MADPDLVAFGAAVVGALVGGAGSVLGSAWVQRRELIRTARVRMYDQFLPELEVSLPLPGHSVTQETRSTVEGLLAALHRSAVIAGDDVETRLVAHLRRCWEERSRAGSDSGTDVYGNEIPAPRRDEEERMRSAVEALEKHLEGKIR